MSFIVLANSIRVILPLRTRFESPAALPTLSGILISQTKESGHCQQCFIELGTSGLPRPFRGERWSYEWREDGDKVLACWLGFPNVFFSSGIDANLRIAVEALGSFGSHKGMLQSLARISISVKADLAGPQISEPSWMPENSPKVFI